jgi:hypothetical protein
MASDTTCSRTQSWSPHSSTPDRKTPNRVFFLADPSCRDRTLLVLGSNTAKQTILVALLDPSTHFRPPLTHTSHHRLALVELNRFIAVSGVTHNRFRRFSTCVSAVSGVSLVGVSLLSADVAVTVVRPEVISQRVSSPEVEQGPIGKLSASCVGWANKRFFYPKNSIWGFPIWRA